MPLPAAANQRLAACAGPAHVNDGLAIQQHRVGSGMHRAPLAVEALRAHCAIDVELVGGLEHDPPAFKADGRGPNGAAVLEGAGKHADGVSLQAAQIDRLIGGGLHLQHDALQPAPGDLDLPAGRQNGAAARGLNERRFAGFDLRRNQHHVAPSRHDVALHVDSRGAGQPAQRAKAQSRGPGVSLTQAQDGGGKAGGIDQRTGAHGNARLVDQHQLAVT